MIEFISGADSAQLDLLSVETAVYCDPDEDHAVQSDYEDSDINILVRRFGLTTDHPLDPSMAQAFGDFSEAGSFHEAHQAVVDAQHAFMSLPSGIRTRFDNNPAQLLDFLSDPRNRDEAVELGLLTPSAVSVTVKEPVKDSDSDPVSASADQS